MDPAVARLMSRTLVHRGPDEGGEWVTPGVALMHRRLSIIDVAGSKQPMSTSDGRFHISFNGEILNYRELRRELDYRFRTDGDTEVVLAMFARHGVRGVRRLRGQFAFAVHDALLHELWLARDRLGILPLYYHRGQHAIAFASEIKALVPAMPDGARLEQSSLHQYLSRRAVPAPSTLVQGVRKVRPGELLRFDAQGVAHAIRYWDPPIPEKPVVLTVSEAVDRVECALVDAVSAALTADVPVGAYLSGGIDSSLVVALASKQVAEPMHTFCASFEDPSVDESHYAERVGMLLGTRHHTVPVTASDFEGLWPRLSWHRDAPVSEPADIAVFKLAQQARRHVKVVLSGEGSDELFGGYPKYRFARATKLAGLMPAGARQRGFTSLERALPRRAHRARIAARAMTGHTSADRALGWFAPFTAGEVAELLGTRAPSERGPRHSDPVDLMSRVDLAAWLPDNLLERGDRMSMAASLELRPAVLDHALVELALRLPAGFKVRNGQTKWILRQVAQRHLPAEIAHRPKIGFKVPLGTWFRGELRDLSHDLLLSQDSRVAGLVDAGAVERLIESHESGRRNEEMRIWTLLSLEQWARVCLTAVE